MTEARSDEDRRDILVARVVDGEATSEDWRELRTIAADDQAIWAEIAEQQDLKRELDDAVEDAISVAERVALPMHEHASVAPNRRVRLVLTTGGWLVAASILVAWTISMREGVRTMPAPGGGPTTAGIASPINTASEALAKYLELGKQSGEVIGELPTSLVIERTPNEDGGYNVIYLRQIVEKTTVDGVYQPATDDAGQTFFVPKSDADPVQPSTDGQPWLPAW